MIEHQYLNNTWIEVSESAYRNNIRFFRQLVGQRTELAAVIKANAYGHGWQSIARLAVQNGVDSFCVHTIDEALRLRRAGFQQNVLIMGPIPLHRLSEAVEDSFRIVAYNRDTLLKLHEVTSEQYKLARVHLKLETGTHRQGIGQEDLAWFLEQFKSTPRVLLEAVYTHFADIEDTTDHSYADYQKYCFNQLISIVRKSGFPILKKHAACSAATMLFPEMHFDLVRVGIGQYGLWPSRETQVSYQEKKGRSESPVLQPVLAWKTRVAQLKTVAAENSIGYGRSYHTTRETRIAVLPVGYADGYDRHLSNQSHVLIRGRRAPVRGRICMNLCMVDVTDIPDVALNDEVTLIGQNGQESITVDHLAGLCGTINYEFVARLSREMPRLITE